MPRIGLSQKLMLYFFQYYYFYLAKNACPLRPGEAGSAGPAGDRGNPGLQAENPFRIGGQLYKHFEISDVI